MCRSRRKEVREIVINELTVLYMTDTVQDKILCTVQANANGHWHDVELIVDTGSSVSIIPESIYQTFFPTCELSEPTVNLFTYSREKIPVKGCMHATVNHDGHSTTGSFLVVKSGTALLGLDLVVALHMRIEGTKVITADSSDGPIAQKTPTVPSATPQLAPEIQVQEIGCAKGFVHKIQLKPVAVPVQQKLRRLPFAVRQAVSDELKDLHEKGIIERIDASPWVSPIVVTRKRWRKTAYVC